MSPRARAAGVSSPASSPHPTRSIAGQARPDVDVAPPAFFEVGVAERAFAVIPRAPGDPCRVLVRGIDPQLHALQPERLEAPAREQLDRAPCDTAPAGARRDDVADLAFLLVQLQLD